MAHSKTPVILLAFANDADAPLRELAVEQDELKAVFRQAERDGKCKLVTLAAATADKLIQAFQENRGRVRVFHYGGHSSQDAIFLRSAYQQRKGLKADNLAEFLALQEGLELAFLNSCLSLPQAKTYHEHGVKAVVATNQKVGDFAARTFARLFYQGIASGAALIEAFREAVAGGAIQCEGQLRDAGFEDVEGPDEFPWQLFPEKPTPWRLPLVAKHLTRIPTITLEREFFGREADMQRLKDTLEHSSKVVLMNGLGGIGKTVLATAYVQQYGNNYGHLAWINRGENLIESVAFNEYLADTLGLPFEKEEEPEARFRRILQKLQQLSGQNLLVIDNAQEQVAQKDIYSLLPGPPNWQVLLTSRLNLGGFERLPLDTLEPEASRKLFRTYFKGKCTDEALEILLKEVGYHTLTIELLAKLLDKLNNILSVSGLTEILKQKQLGDPDLQEKVWARHSGEERGIYLHLMKAFELANLSNREIGLLKQFVVLPVERYTVASLAVFLQEKPLGLNKVLNSLADKGWLSLHKDKTFSIHRLIRQVAEYQLKLVYADVKTLINSISNLLYIDHAKDNPVDKFTYVIFGAHILQIIPNQTEEDFARFQSNLALVYKDLGDYEQARDLLKAALQSDISNFGEQHPNTAIRRSNLALVYKDLGDYEQARDLLKAALQSDISNFGEQHPTTAISRSNLATVYQDLGDYEQARDLLKGALQSAISNFGEQHPTTAISRSNLALVYQDLGDYEQARDLLTAALQSAISNFGEQHPTMARSRSNLATVYQDLGDYEQARDLLTAALQSAISNFGEQHPTTAISRSNLATVYKALGDYEQARDLLTAALQSDISNFGEQHPNTARSRSNLALVYQDLGDYEQARDLLTAALQSAISNFGHQHPTTAIRRSNLATVYQGLGDYEQAKELFQKAFNALKSSLGEHHPNTQTVKQWLDGME